MCLAFGPSGEQPIGNRIPDRLRNFLFRLRGIDDDAALGLGCGDIEVGCAQSFMEGEAFAFEPIGGNAWATPLHGAGEADLRRQIENDGEIGARSRRK